MKKWIVGLASCLVLGAVTYIGASTWTGETIKDLSYYSIVQAVNRVMGTAGSAIPRGILQLGGSDGTYSRALKVDASGNLSVYNSSSSTYPTFITQVAGTKLSVLSRLQATDGTNYYPVLSDASGHLQVDALSAVVSGSLTTCGTATVSGTVNNTLVANSLRDYPGNTTACTDGHLDTGLLVTGVNMWRVGDVVESDVNQTVTITGDSGVPIVRVSLNAEEGDRFISFPNPISAAGTIDATFSQPSRKGMCVQLYGR